MPGGLGGKKEIVEDRGADSRTDDVPEKKKNNKKLLLYLLGSLLLVLIVGAVSAYFIWKSPAPAAREEKTPQTAAGPAQELEISSKPEFLVLKPPVLEMKGFLVEISGEKEGAKILSCDVTLQFQADYDGYRPDIEERLRKLIHQELMRKNPADLTGEEKQKEFSRELHNKLKLYFNNQDVIEKVKITRLIII